MSAYDARYDLQHNGEFFRNGPWSGEGAGWSCRGTHRIRADELERQNSELYAECCPDEDGWITFDDAELCVECRTDTTDPDNAEWVDVAIR